MKQTVRPNPTRSRRCSGLSLTEVLIVIAIILAVAAIAMPVFSSVKASGRIAKSASNLRQLYQSLELYRSDYGGIDDANSTSGLGMPTDRVYMLNRWGTAGAAWRSPCQSSPKVMKASLTRMRGEITYAVPFYEDETLASGGNPHYRDYLASYRMNAVAFYDGYCTGDETAAKNLYLKKRALSVLLSGQLVNRMRFGRLDYLDFYSGDKVE